MCVCVHARARARGRTRARVCRVHAYRVGIKNGFFTLGKQTIMERSTHFFCRTSSSYNVQTIDTLWRIRLKFD